MNTTPTNPRTIDGPYHDDPGDEFLLEEIVRELGDTLAGEVTTGRDWIETVELPRVGDTLVLRLANGQVVILTAVLSEGDPCDWCGKDIGDPNTASPLIGPANYALGRQGGEQGVYCSNECLDRVCRSAGWSTNAVPSDRVLTDAMIADAHALADALIERVRATVPPGGVVTPSEADELWDRAIENVRPGWARVLVSMEDEGPDEGPPPIETPYSCDWCGSFKTPEMGPVYVFGDSRYHLMCLETAEGPEGGPEDVVADEMDAAVRRDVESLSDGEFIAKYAVTPSAVVTLTATEAELARRAVAFLLEELQESGSHEVPEALFYGVRLDDLVSLCNHLAGA